MAFPKIPGGSTPEREHYTDNTLQYVLSSLGQQNHFEGEVTQMKMVLSKQRCLCKVSWIFCIKVTKRESLKDIVLKLLSKANVSWLALIIINSPP